MYRFLRAATLLAGLLTLSLNVFGGAIITTGNVSLGVEDSGQLNFGGTGIFYAGVGDAIIPGCPCEGWGVRMNNDDLLRTWANNASGSGGIGAAVLSGVTASTAISTVTPIWDSDVSIVHSFAPSSQADVFAVTVTVANSGTTNYTNLQYQRAMDWDVTPTAFSEYVTHQGVVANLTSNGGNILYASDDGFHDNGDWTGSFLNPATVNTNFVDDGPADHGSLFIFDFGALAAGASKTFTIYYGASSGETSAIAKIAALGLNVYSLGQSNTYGGADAEGITDGTATFLFGFEGVGTVIVEPVPEPSTYMLLGGGLVALFAVRRRFAK